MEIYLKKDVVLSGKVSNEGILAYVALRGIFRYESRLTDYVTINRMAFELCGTCQEYKEGLRNSLFMGLKELEEMKLISVVRLNATEMVIDASKLYINLNDCFWTKVYSEEISKIVNTVARNDSMMQVLRYFIVMVGTFNNSRNMAEYKGIVGSMTIDVLAKDASISPRSAKKYNDILIDMELIYIYRSEEYMRDDDNGIKRLSNTYSRYRDKGRCIMFGCGKAGAYESNGNIIYSKKSVEKTNRNRALAQMYNSLCKGSEKYSENEIREVYNYCNNMNMSLARDIERGITSKGYLEASRAKIRDMSVFDKYDFLKKDEKVECDDLEWLDLPACGDIWGEPNEMTI